MLIGLTGCKGVGKDTAAQWLIDEYGFTRIAFADKLKQAVGNLFDIERSHVDDLKEYMAWVELRHPLSAEAISLSWRTFLQRFGTEMGRQTFGENFWVDQWSRTYDDLCERNYKTKVVVTDVRFRNEALRIHNYEGGIIEIQRPGHEPDGHASEEPIDRALVDAVIVNDSDMQRFHDRFLATVEGLKVGIVS